MSISQIIINLLEKKNKSRYWLAKESGVSESYISDLIHDKYTNPSIKILSKLAKALKVPVSKLIDKSDDSD